MIMTYNWGCSLFVFKSLATNDSVTLRNWIRLYAMVRSFDRSSSFHLGCSSFYYFPSKKKIIFLHGISLSIGLPHCISIALFMFPLGFFITGSLLSLSLLGCHLKNRRRGEFLFSGYSSLYFSLVHIREFLFIPSTLRVVFGAWNHLVRGVRTARR